MIAYFDAIQSDTMKEVIINHFILSHTQICTNHAYTIYTMKMQLKR